MKRALLLSLLLGFGFAFAAFLPARMHAAADGTPAPAQELDPSEILKPPTNDWPTFNGDYTGRRYSTLAQINRQNIGSLTLAWAYQTHSRSLESMPIEVGGIMYITASDQMWAIDARTGRQIWQFQRPGAAGGGNKGAAMWHDRLYMTTPDDHLLCIDAHNGKQIWDIQIDDPALKAFGSVAPLVIRDHIIVGTSGDTADLPGFLLSVDPMTGKIEWRWDAMPKPDDTVAWNSWPHEHTDVVTRGGGMTWLTGTYDPGLNLLYWGTGNPHPVENGDTRVGSNLYTCTIVALDPDTGKLVWHFQTSPHDTHDWDSSQTPVLVDGTFDGKPRKMVVTASRNGYYFTLDRVTGEHLVTGKFSESANWAQGYTKTGAPLRDPKKDFDIGGALVSPANGGITNWPPPAYSPDTGLFYVPQNDSYAMYYLTEIDPRGAMGLGGKEEQGVGSTGSYMTAIDYKTGKVVWRHQFPGTGGGGPPGLLTTAGKLLFGGDLGGNIVAYDPADAKPLWHSHIGQVSNAPETYMLDGHQYLLVAAGDTLFSFILY
jgi:alcohol dehydrogenase (cytochrome c)